MKRLKIIVIQELEVPDEAVVTVHPADQVECVEVQDKYFLPTITWLERADEEEIAADVNEDSQDEGADWYLSDHADMLFAGVIGEDGIIHELKAKMDKV